MKKITFLSIIVLAATLALPQNVSAQSEKTKTFSGVKTVRLNSSSGDLKIQRSKDASVTAFVRTTDDFDKTGEINMDQDGDQLILKETRSERNSRGSANWTLSVPDGIKIKLVTGSGDITATDIKADIDGTTGSGDVEFTKVSGTVDATTGSGDIMLSDSNGEFRVTTGSGSGTIQNIKGSIKLTCGSGNIRVGDSQAAFTMTTGSGTVTSKNITLNGSSKFTSGSGDTSVTLAASPKFNISITSGSGDAELNFNGNEIAGEIVMQANKGNGNIQAPFGFDKVEEVDNGGRDNITVKKTVVKGGGSNLIKISTGSGNAVLTK